MPIDFAVWSREVFLTKFIKNPYFLINIKLSVKHFKVPIYHFIKLDFILHEKNILIYFNRGLFYFFVFSAQFISYLVVMVNNILMFHFKIFI